MNRLKKVEEMVNAFPQELEGKVECLTVSPHKPLDVLTDKEIILQIPKFRDFDSLNHMMAVLLDWTLEFKVKTYFINGNTIKVCFRKKEVADLVKAKIEGHS